MPILDLYRRNRRDYHIKQRPAGKDAGREKYLKRVAKVSIGAAAWMRQRVRPLVFRGLLVVGVAAAQEIEEINTPQLLATQLIPKVVITLDTFTPLQYDSKFGFTRQDVVDLMREMRIPADFSIGEGKHAFWVSGVHAFLYNREIM
jgi:hypothetical protein